MSDKDHKINRSRRRFIILSGVTVSAIAMSGLLYPRLMQYKGSRVWPGHAEGNVDESPVDAKVINNVVIFIGALYGQELDTTDKIDLADRLAFAAREDSGWRDEYTWLATYADHQALKLGFSNLEACNKEQLDAVVGKVLGAPVSSKRSKLLALISNDEFNRRRMLTSTVEHLVRVYEGSGAPWRRRGYTSWPGVPGDPLAYTRTGPEYIW